MQITQPCLLAVVLLSAAVAPPAWAQNAEEFLAVPSVGVLRFKTIPSPKLPQFQSIPTPPRPSFAYIPSPDVTGFLPIPRPGDVPKETAKANVTAKSEKAETETKKTPAAPAVAEANGGGAKAGTTSMFEVEQVE